MALASVQDKPRLFSTFLMWLLADRFHDLPEVGDLDKPKLVLFLDEAHLLVDDASEAFLETIARTVRLVRSKGVGVLFVTRTPKDVPAEVLAQLGNRVQHALRALTPDDTRALLATYGTALDHDSAYERLLAKVVPPEPPHEPPAPPAPKDDERRRERDVVADVLGSGGFKSLARSAASAAGREISRSLVGTPAPAAAERVGRSPCTRPEPARNTRVAPRKPQLPSVAVSVTETPEDRCRRRRPPAPAVRPPRR